MAQENSLADALAQCQEDRVKALLREKLDANLPAAEVLAECNRGMGELGDRFERGECFLPELMFGGMIMKKVLADLSPMLGDAQSTGSAGTIVIGSVQHDVHDIGKDIVAMILRGTGFEVVDLGVDVAPDKFVEAINNHKPFLVGMSMLLTTCFKSASATVEAIQSAGVRDKISLMVGGAAASELLREKIGCDFYGKTAIDGVKYADSLAGKA